MRLFILCAGLVLAACQTVPVAPPVARVACPPSLVQVVQPQPTVPDNAGAMEFKDTPESLAGAALYLAYVDELALWGRSMMARAVTAKTHCEGK